MPSRLPSGPSPKDKGFMSQNLSALLGSRVWGRRTLILETSPGVSRELEASIPVHGAFGHLSACVPRGSSNQ